MATLRTQHGINILFLFIVHLNHGITKPLQTFSEEQFLQELSDDRGNSQGTHHPTVRSRPPYLGNLHLGFHHPHHHQPSEASENEIYDSDESNLLRTPLDRGPHFDLSASKNITALVGKTAYLNCRVKNIGNKTVSWVRHRDIHLLTVGRFTYTSDQRFQAVHNPQTDDWSLQIRYPQKRDTGVYECQISTTPPVGHSMFLSVVEPITTIVGVPDLYINTGSTVNLTCIVRNSPEPPSTIIWTHNNQEINYDSPRGGVSVITEKGETTTSYLLIQRARTTDTGKYVCSPSNADPSTINVHILNGEHPAAMQHAGQLRIGDPLYVFVLWLISYLFGRR
ncbi:zwei Ig domain protein zig-8-like [Anopheles stephensi]|uniref:zwei Ig domain protein zig-8-like n=1 Tax=Anopheles stephensi TaxID=30069 RepID=UPI0016587E5F|nr:zwei Ig domain protein zig-8-like [Anopheles stephensi]XP_035917564.1 zwei Ig domain protein zig-8-like [Anopheles stephensi]XP_035917565.1 zwei Ig domain protein zig-8-like [Anopheles stephensi]